MLLALWSWRTGEWAPPYVPLLNVYTTGDNPSIAKPQKVKQKQEEDEALLLIFGAL